MIRNSRSRRFQAGHSLPEPLRELNQALRIGLVNEHTEADILSNAKARLLAEHDQSQEPATQQAVDSTDEPIATPAGARRWARAPLYVGCAVLLVIVSLSTLVWLASHVDDAGITTIAQASLATTLLLLQVVKSARRDFHR